MRSKDWNQLVAGLLLAPVALTARADTFLREDQAAAVLFPGVQLQPRWIDLTSAQIKAIAKASGTKPLSPRLRLWQGPAGETMAVDRVLGKHEFITYAVGLGPEGKIRGVEILDYRETYGGQIRDPGWRRNFTGKSAKDPVALDKDIPNISGATLSSKHVTDGVRRILATYEILQRHP